MQNKKSKSSISPKTSNKKMTSAKSINVVEQSVNDCLVTNYMPYAMSVIISRAIVEIDGFKPSHRKLLYMMYTMKLLNGNYTKSANIVGNTMKLNPHGDSSIYDAMVRMTDSNESLLFPFVKGKGSFGKHYSRDMKPAAYRYTEAMLTRQSEAIFRDLDKHAIDMIDNYDGSMKEPALMPVVFPTILANCNQGIAVSMASNICSFNLSELCETTIALMKNPKADLHKTLLAPDFSTGGELIYNKSELEDIYKTGRGSFKIRSTWAYDKKAHCIDILSIPYTTTVEAIIERVVELSKSGRIREINDIRDETDLHGLKITIDLKKDVDPEKLMQKLFKLTTLQDSFPCNFNILLDGNPRVIGVREILLNWIDFRIGCKKRAISYDLERKEERLNIMNGLLSIMADIDKIIKIIRATKDDNLVIDNLMKKFKLDIKQAEYIADIKLRNLNQNYILNLTKDYQKLADEIESLKSDLLDDKRIKAIITKELRDIIKKYGTPRKTSIIENAHIEFVEPEDAAFRLSLLLTKESYVKRLAENAIIDDSQKMKEDDEIVEFFPSIFSDNELLIFSDKCTVYKKKLDELPIGKSNVLGEYLPSIVGMPIDENSIFCCVLEQDKYLLFCFENGKIAKIPMRSYQTLTNRKRLLNAYYDGSKLISVLKVDNCDTIQLNLSNGKTKAVKVSKITEKASKNSMGIQVFSSKTAIIEDVTLIK